MRTLTLLLIVAGACSRSEAPEKQNEKPAAQEAATSTQPPEETAPVVDLDAPPSLELLDAGKDPQKRLRHDFKKGTKHTLRVHSESRVDAAVFPVGALTVMPDLDYGLEAVVKTVAADGTAEVELRVVDVKVKASKEVGTQMRLATMQAAAALKGTLGRTSIGPRGLVGPVEMRDIPAQASPRVYEMVEQIGRALQLASLPLPEEPVGKGATWVRSEAIEHRGAGIRQRSTFELLSVDKERVRAKVTLEQTAPVPQRFTPPGGQWDLRLVEHRFQGEGEGTWQLGKLAPRSATESTTTTLISERRAAQPQFVIIGTELKLEVQRAK